MTTNTLLASEQLGKEIIKYSHRATLDEIKIKEFNLNISLYVDSFEEDVQVDLQEVSSKLKDLHQNETNLQSEISKFCEELGIDKPF